ncbi:hypothetical protein [Parapedobacter soli]|uniref:hypothetical protein n=1 Tax=Parapedobacter soli TaxID=416955 RepID=UPI0021C6B472|nr:hypothetical protein [Parapedobacter soli]
MTLVFQGPTLPLFIRWLKEEEIDEAVDQMESIRLRLRAEAAEENLAGATLTTAPNSTGSAKRAATTRR